MRTISTFSPSRAIRAINRKTGASQRSRPRAHEDGHDDDSVESDGADLDAPMPPEPGVGRLVDKFV